MKINIRFILQSFLLLILLISCTPGKKENPAHIRTIGSIERISGNIDQIIKPGAVIEVLAEGFDWSEGPVWIPSGNYLLFSDIPPNRIYKWSEPDSIQLYLEPSGYTGAGQRGGEVGSNGLLLDPQGRLVLCQHGDRRVAVMNASLDQPQSDFQTLAGDFEGKKLNSPNDATFDAKGNLYFTDPPYGLEKQMEDSLKEIEFQGVYRMPVGGKPELLTGELSRPNGIGLSPDEKTLYVANSDPDKAIWMAFDLAEDGKISNGRVFYDATAKTGSEPGLPDGLKVDKNGNVFATGPGGVWVFDPAGTPLGIIHTTVATANCAFNADQSILYITADMYLLRVTLK
jgi:gluconolactonase